MLNNWQFLPGLRRLQPEGEQVYTVIDGTDDSQKEHACKTEHQAIKVSGRFF